jgi:hypothetical protein
VLEDAPADPSSFESSDTPHPRPSTGRGHSTRTDQTACGDSRLRSHLGMARFGEVAEGCRGPGRRPATRSGSSTRRRGGGDASPGRRRASHRLPVSLSWSVLRKPGHAFERFTLRRLGAGSTRGDRPDPRSLRVLLGSLGTTELAARPAQGIRAAGQTGVAGGRRTTPS